MIACKAPEDQVKAYKTQMEPCFKCGMVGHFAKDCPMNPHASKPCFKCGMPGHQSMYAIYIAFLTSNLVRECTGADTRHCYICKQQGHLSTNCPQGSSQAPRSY